ncbi:hypothetical protein A2U01_0082872, partial [Trifolium medium]|nr:hypothetical protein [Trifolium medium]
MEILEFLSVLGARRQAEGRKAPAPAAVFCFVLLPAQRA